MAGFFIRVVIAEWMFAAFAKRRKHFVLRLVCSFGLAMALQYAYEQCLPIFFHGEIPPVMSIARGILLLMTTTAALYFSFDCSLENAIVYSTDGYAAQNSVYYLIPLILDSLPLPVGSNPALFYRIANMAIPLLMYIPFFLWICYVHKKNPPTGKLGLPAIVASILIVFMTMVFSVFAPWETNFLWLGLYSTVCSILVIGIHLGLFEMSAIEQRLIIMEQMEQAKWEQQQLSRELIEQINIKSHDLKQQINILLSENPQKREKLLSDLMQTLEAYDSMVRTGNSYLDTLLTEKSLICLRHNIRCTYIVDGQSLAFMDPMDIARLFGNALDNSIESVKLYEDSEKRFINLNVSRQGHLLLVHVENYFDGKVSFKNGLPETTKDNKNVHGFGTKSIQSVVEKYHGNMNIRTENQLFTLDILFTYTPGIVT